MSDLPTSDELDALIAEAREYVQGWERTSEDRVPRPHDQAERIPFWNDARTSLTDAENAKRHDAIKAWEGLHGHDVRTGCYPEYGCAVIDSYSADVILRLLDALSALRDTNPDEWEYGVRRDVLHAQQPASIRPTLEEARKAADWYTPLDGVPATLLRRTPEVPAGPWLPVPSSPEGSKK